MLLPFIAYSNYTSSPSVLKRKVATSALMKTLQPLDRLRVMAAACNNSEEEEVMVIKSDETIES